MKPSMSMKLEEESIPVLGKLGNGLYDLPMSINEKNGTSQLYEQDVVFGFIEEKDFVATDKSIENSDIFLPVIKHQFFYIADY